MERTEKPTSKRLEEARKRGEIARSSELTGALILLGGLLILYGISSFLEDRFYQLFVLSFSGQLDLKQGFSLFLFPLIYFFFGLFFLAVLANLIQGGWIFSWERVAPKWRKRPFFSLFKGGFAILKLIIVAVLGYFEWKTLQTLFYSFTFLNAPEKLKALFHEAFSFAFKVVIALLVFSLIDFFYQRWKYQKNLRMSKQEIKDERRENEGNRLTKRFITRK